MVRWHELDAKLSGPRRASAMGDAQGNGGRGAAGGVEENPTKGMRRKRGNRRRRRETAVDDSRKEMAGRVAKHQAD